MRSAAGSVSAKGFSTTTARTPSAAAAARTSSSRAAGPPPPAAGNPARRAERAGAGQGEAPRAQEGRRARRETRLEVGEEPVVRRVEVGERRAALPLRGELHVLVLGQHVAIRAE